jgi:hypothetical protein
LQTVSCLPQLTELDLWVECNAPIPLSLFTNLSNFSVRGEFAPLVISEIAAVVANSPQLRSLEVHYLDNSSTLPTLSALFAKIPTTNALCLKHLAVCSIDATVDQVALPHLTRLTSFTFQVNNPDIAQSVWTSFRINNVKLTDVNIGGIITEETMVYLSSFSGLSKLIVDFGKTLVVERVKKMFFEMVLPKHVQSLQTLRIHVIGQEKWVKSPRYIFVLLFP